MASKKETTAEEKKAPTLEESLAEAQKQAAALDVPNAGEAEKAIVALTRAVSLLAE